MTTLGDEQGINWLHAYTVPGEPRREYQKVRVLAWTDSGAVVIGLVDGPLPTDRPSTVRLSELRRVLS